MTTAAATRKKVSSTHKEAAAASTSQIEKTRVNLDLEPEFLSEIEDWRFENRFASRQEAMRELIRRGMKTK